MSIAAPFKGKLICVGWNKTGTTSMGWAFSRLGFRHRGYSYGAAKKMARNGFNPKLLRGARAFDDLPWHLFYKEIDAHFPDSRFVHTVRDPWGWLKSYRAHRERLTGGIEDEKLIPLQRSIYGKPYEELSDAELLTAYTRRVDEVRRHFRNRPEVFMEIDLKDFEKQGWTRLCDFLELPMPKRRDFPRGNTKRQSERLIEQRALTDQRKPK